MDLSKHMNLQLLSLVGGMDFEKQQKKVRKKSGGFSRGNTRQTDRFYRTKTDQSSKGRNTGD